MREIKFRGKDINTGKWSYGSLITCEQYTDIWTGAEDGVVTRTEVDPETVGQFTGLCDQNDTEIYEGDIITIASDTTPYSIVFNKGAFVLGEDDIWFSGYGLCRFARKASIVGNIHDNPGLITYIPRPTTC